MIETSPVVEGLFMIHRIISRGISVSIRKCDEYLGKEGIPPIEIKGFSTFVATLSRVTHSHHLSEDEIAFPYFKDFIEAPYTRLKDDHQTISRILVKLDQSLSNISSEGVGKLREVLGEFEKLWISHIQIEEENFTAEKVQKMVEMEEQINIAEKLANHGSKNSGPGPLALPFMFYNLEGRDREAFMKHFPWIVRKVLVPVIWKEKWKPMNQFFISS